MYLIMKFQNNFFLIFVTSPINIPFLFLSKQPTIKIITIRTKNNAIKNEIPPRLLSNESFSSKLTGKFRSSIIAYLSKEDKLMIPFTVVSNRSTLAGKFIPHLRHTNRIIYIMIYISNSEDITFFATTCITMDITIVVVETSDATFAKV